MAKPILSDITVFDATIGTTIDFLLYGKATSVTYFVYDNETGDQVAAGSAEIEGLSANKSFPFPAGKLTNKLYPYFMKIQSEYEGEQTELSDPILFYCKSKPTLQFANLSTSTPNTINTSSYQFELNYINDPSQGESLNSYKYYLYDSTRTLLVESKEYYGDIANGFVIDGFSNNGIYYVRGTGSSINGYEFDTGYLSLSVSYNVELNRTLLNVVNDPKNGIMRVNSTIAFMDGVSIGDIEYIHLKDDNYAANLVDGSIAYTIPYQIEAYSTEEYSIKITVKPVVHKNIIVISQEDDLYYISTNIRAFTDYTDNAEKFFVILESDDYILESNYLNRLPEDHFVNIYIQFKDNLFSIYISDAGTLLEEDSEDESAEDGTETTE